MFKDQSSIKNYKIIKLPQFSNPQKQQTNQQNLLINAEHQQKANNPNSLSNVQQQQPNIPPMNRLKVPQVIQNISYISNINSFTNAQKQKPVNNQPNNLYNSFSYAHQLHKNNYQPSFSQSNNIPQPTINQSQRFTQKNQKTQIKIDRNFTSLYKNIDSQHIPQIVQPQPQPLFNDDEPLIQKVKQQLKNGKIELQIKSQRSLVKLKTVTELPAMISIKSSGGSRTSVDLICVIDNSGSMEGQKIQLVKSTVQFLLEALTPADRLSIITFNNSATRLCQLKCVSGQNMNTFLKIVHSIRATGGTNINSGLQLALKTIRERKFTNNVTSIFLLSDGQDKGSEKTFKQSLQENINKQLGIFTLHSFGFGSDHDQNLMSKLSQMKDGAFYFIKQLATLDQAFCNALGGIISLVANQITIQINNISKNIVKGVRIKKVYGKMWQKINDNQYKIKLSQIISGISKDFVFQIQIPSINIQVGDIQRDHSIIEAIFTAKSILNQNINGQGHLELTLLNQNEDIPDSVENIQVIQNYLRVQAAEAIQQNLKKADQKQFKQAQQGIDSMIQNIQGNKKARKQKMMTLITDLQQIKQKCTQKQYGSSGRKLMTSMKASHTMQNNFQYSNQVQSTMLIGLRSTKF